MAYDREKVIDDYKAAYEAANGFPIKVSYERGWFTIGRPLGNGYSRKRRAREIIEMTERLNARLAAPIRKDQS